MEKPNRWLLYGCTLHEWVQPGNVIQDAEVMLLRLCSPVLGFKSRDLFASCTKTGSSNIHILCKTWLTNVDSDEVMSLTSTGHYNLQTHNMCCRCKRKDVSTIRIWACIYLLIDRSLIMEASHWRVSSVKCNKVCLHLVLVTEVVVLQLWRTMTWSANWIFSFMLIYIA